MKKPAKLFALVALCSALSSPTLLAQTALNTGYFNDGYVFNHNLNPALVPTMSYFSMPVLNFSAATESNMSASNFLFKLNNGKIGTFLHPDVTAAQALSKLSPTNKLDFQTNITLLAAGWFNGKGTIFNSLDLTHYINGNINLPYDLFAFAKGTNNATTGKYDLGSTLINANEYFALSFGQSFAIGQQKNIRVGYKVKFLFGGAEVNAKFDTFNLQMTGERYDIKTVGTMRTNVVSFGTKTLDDGRVVYDFGSVKADQPGDIVNTLTKNVGLAGDLGVCWDVTDWIQVSAAAQNFGFINLNNCYNGTANGNVVYTAKAGTSVEEQLNGFLKDLGDITNFAPDGEPTKVKTTLPWKLRIGAQVRIPVYKKVSVGALYTNQFHSVYGWNEFRLSANYDVLRFLAISASYGTGTFGGQFGAMLNIHAKGIAFHIGADNIPTKYLAQGIPANTGTTNVNVGLSFQFGKYFGRYPKEK